jgi:hypothetical protein
MHKPVTCSYSAAGQQALEWVQRQTDALGMPIDEEIRKPVAAFKILGVRTIMSCQGHQERALPYPWISFNAQDLAKLKAALQLYPLPGFTFEHGRRLLPAQAAETADGQAVSWLSQRAELNQWATAILQDSSFQVEQSQ